MAKPTVKGSDSIVWLNRSIFASKFIKSSSDSDGDTIEKVRFYDTKAGGGYFTVGGVVQDARKFFEVSMSNLNTVRYHAGDSISNEFIRVGVFANGNWSSSEIVTGYTTRKTNNKAPLVKALSRAVVEDESFAAANIIGGRDPDGYPLLRYQIRDLNTRAASGHFRLGRAKKNGTFTVTAEQLKDLSFVAGNGDWVDDYEVRVYDGNLWSNFKSATVTSKANKSAPVLRSKYISIESNAELKANKLFAGTDADGNTFKAFRFRDMSSTVKSGKFFVDGVEKADKQWFQVTAEELLKTSFVANDTNHLEYIQIAAFDGKRWSEAVTSNINVKAVAKLDTKAVPFVNAFESVAASSFIVQGDSGPVVQLYEIKEENTVGVGGRLELNGAILNPNQTHVLTAAQFDNLTFVGGTSVNRQLDEIKVRLNNGFGWSDWNTVAMRTEPNAIDAMKQVYPYSFFPLDNTWFQYTSDFPLEMTYSFIDQLEPSVQGIFSFDRMNGQNQRKNVRALMAELDRMLDFITFTETIETGDINWGQTFDVTRSALAFRPDLEIVSPATGYILLPESDEFANIDPGSVAYSVAWQGLAELFSIENPLSATTPPLAQPTENRSYSHTFYSGFDWGAPSLSLGLYDFAAIHDMYGEGRNREGNNTYTFGNYNPDVDGAESDDQFFYSIHDTDGIDTLSFANQQFSSLIDLRSGSLSSAGQIQDLAGELTPNENNVSITFNTLIENAIGGISAETIIGNQLDNRLIGNGGDDVLRGLDGDDFLAGGKGNDIYEFKVGDDNDRIDERRADSGRDILSLGGHIDSLNALNDISARRQGQDLLIRMTIDGGESQGSVRIVKQGILESQVETLRMFNKNKARILADVDLVSVFENSTNAYQTFKIGTNRTNRGFIATPV